MDLIDMLILFVVFFNICIFIWLCNILIYTPLNYLFFGQDNFGIIGQSSYYAITTVSETFPSYTLVIYYVITNNIRYPNNPDTGKPWYEDATKPEAAASAKNLIMQALGE
jgi:hypothetical protein